MIITQRVLVTAGASGIGPAIAKAFAADGARVHIADMNKQAVKDVTEANDRISGSVAVRSRRTRPLLMRS